METIRDADGEGNPTDLQNTGGTSIAVLPDGSVLRTESGRQRILRDWPDGHTTIFAGDESAPPNSGDGGPAIEAGFDSPQSIAVGPDGSVYVADVTARVVRKITTDGVIRRVAGTGSYLQGSDPRNPLDVALSFPQDVDVADDGTLYIADGGGLWMLDPGGTMTRFAGVTFYGCGTEGSGCRFFSPPAYRIATASDGTLYWYASNGTGVGQLYRYRQGEENPELLASINAEEEPNEGPIAVANVVPQSIEVDTLDRLIIADARLGMTGVWRLDADNRVRRIGLTGDQGTDASGRYSGEGGAFTKADGSPNSISRGPDGLYIMEGTQSVQIRRVSPALKRYPIGNTLIPSEDGAEVYRFDRAGRHLETLDGLTERQLRSFAYNAAGQITSITETDLGTTTFAYSAGSVTVTGPDGQETVLTLDAAGRATDIQNAAGDSQAYEYTPAGLLTRYENELGDATTFTWSPTGRLLSDTSPEGRSQTLSRTETGRSTQVQHHDAAGATTTYDRDKTADGRPRTSVTKPDGAVATTEDRLSDGTATRTTHADGTISDRARGDDPRWGTMVSSSSGSATLPSGLATTGGSSTAVNRDAGDDPNDPFSFQTVVDTYTLNGRSGTSTYDKTDRTSTTVSPMGRQSQVEFDEDDRPIRISSPGRDDITLEYDARGRPVSVDQGTAASTVTYGTDGRPSQYVDEENGVTQITRDDVGRPTSVTRPDGETVSTTYDAAGQVTAITAPDGRQFTFTYDEDGALTGAARPARTGSSDPTLSGAIAYDAAGRPATVTAASGEETDVQYDTIGRTAKVEADDGTSTTMAYSQTGARPLSTLSTNEGVATNMTFDGPLLTAVTTAGEGDDPAATVGTQLAYDNALRPSSETVDGSAVAYQYNNDDQPTQIGPVALAYGAATGDLASTTAGVSVNRYTVDGQGKLASHESVVNAAGPETPAFSETVVRDDLGRITTRTETNGAGPAVSHQYTYDDAGRLTAISSGAGVTETYGYDNTGGLTSRGTGALSAWIATDGHGRPTSSATGMAAQWSTDGELETLTRPGSGTSTLTYDGLQRIKTIQTPSGDIGEYTYDGAGRRVALRVAGAIQRRYIYGAGLFPRARADADGDVIERYIYTTAAHVPDVIVRRDGQRLRLIRDALGSVRTVIDIDTGATVQQLTYDAYGTVLTDTAPGTQPFGFKGTLSDPIANAAGLVWMGVRAYTPALARFATPDPMGLLAAWNEHDAFAGDPINLSDPDGRLPSVSDVVDAVDGAAAGASTWGARIGSAAALGALGCAVTVAGGPVCAGLVLTATGATVVSLTADAYLFARGKTDAGGLAWSALAGASAGASRLIPYEEAKLFAEGLSALWTWSGLGYNESRPLWDNDDIWCL